jgi:putative ABC transport system permease protein
VSSTLVSVGPPLAAVLVVLTALGAGVAAVAGLGHGRGVVTAAVRAALQLAVIAAVITAVLGALPLAAAFVTAMYAVATATAGRRLRVGRQAWRLLLPLGAGSLPVVGALLVTGVVPAEPLAVIPVAGILVGGAMTATTLAGRRALDELATRHGEVEAGLAIGLLPRDARLEIARPAAADALVPVLDQTRTVGLVTLPGAFVGMLLGGATPVAAAGVQLLVLVALLAVEATAVAGTAERGARASLQRGGGG